MDRIRRVKARWKKEQRQWKRGGGNESIKNLSSVRCPNRWRGEDGGGGGSTGKLRAANYIAFKINY